MSAKPEIRVVDDTDDLQESLQNEIERLGTNLSSFGLENPKITRSSSLSHAHRKVKNNQPALIVLNPDTQLGSKGPAPREASEIIDFVGGNVPILVWLTGPDGGWARETITRKKVSVWNFGVGLEQA
jgi:hypothetical protein